MDHLKMLYYQYKDPIVEIRCYLHVISYTSKMLSLYWIGVQTIDKSLPVHEWNVVTCHKVAIN